LTTKSIEFSYSEKDKFLFSDDSSASSNGRKRKSLSRQIYVGAII